MVILDLPPDIMRHVGSFLNGKALLNLRGTDRYFRDFFSLDEVIRNVFERCQNDRICFNSQQLENMMNYGADAYTGTLNIHTIRLEGPFSEIDLDSVSQLFPNVKELSFVRCKWTGLALFALPQNFPSLTSLDLSHGNIRILPTFRQMLSLRSLTVQGTSLKSLRFLETLSLTNLNLASTVVSDLAPLSMQRSLKVLNLQYCKHITLLDPISELSLKALNISGTKVLDLTPLKRMGSLEELSMIETKVQSLEPLRSLTLKKLDMIDTVVGDLAPIGNMSSLTYFRIESPNIRDWTPLRNLPLEHLFVRSAQFTHLRDLEQMYSLKTLDINWSPVIDLSPIRNLSLTSFIGDQCPIRDISPLRGMRSLESISLYLTEIQDPEQLRGFGAATSLDIRSTPLSQGSFSNYQSDILTFRQLDRDHPNLTIEGLIALYNDIPISETSEREYSEVSLEDRWDLLDRL